MSEFIASIIRQAGDLPVVEIVALVLGIAYLLLAIRESIWCWLCAFISSMIFAFLFAGARIYMDAGLQLFYAAMAIYGAWSWQFAGGKSSSLPVTRWSEKRHALAMVAVVTASASTGLALSTWTDAAFPYIDSFTTYASLWATFLVARKILENWWYWLVIDAISIAIYLERGLSFAALLFAVYLALIPFGLIAWTRSFRETSAEQSLA